MMTMPDWEDLRMFLAAARLRRIGPAARFLGVAPTTLTRRLARLEKTLGSRLFDSAGGERVLSERGQILLTHAEQMESVALTGTAEVMGEASLLSGQVRLSIAEGVGTWVLAPELSGFHTRYPNIRLDLVTASGFLNPSRREADMALMLGQPQKGRQSVQRLADYRLHLYCAEKYLARESAPRTIDALLRHTLVGYVPDFIFSPELDYLNEIHAGVEAHLRATSINMQHRMIAGGAGIGVLPEFIAKHDPSLIRLFGDEVVITRSFWLVVHEDVRKLARIEAVVQWLRACITSLGS